MCRFPRAHCHKTQRVDGENIVRAVIGNAVSARHAKHRRKAQSLRRLAASAALLLAAFAVPRQAQTSPPAPIDYYRLAPGFIAETKNSEGWATGFAAVNPWGQYTAYLMSTNAKRQRTWRIEHYLPNPDGLTAQGSTMYLLEGSERALVIDTANPALAQDGVNDLKTVVRQLLGHTNDGQVIAKPIDFVVANTHNHPDHIGENHRMADRTVYYMDLDWPDKDAPKNYVPIREGGGATPHGNGMAVSEIDLGARTVKAVAIPPHSQGSTGYLDVENQMLVSGDALGSAWPFIQRGPVSQYAASVHHVLGLTRDLPMLAVLPAHFYQIAAWDRGRPPLNGRPLDRQYILDQAQDADGILDGTIIGEPFLVAGRSAVWAKYGSAQIVYSIATLYPKDVIPAVPYHAIKIPGTFRRSWVSDDQLSPLFNIKSDFYLIRGPVGESIFVLKGSKRTLLIGTGSGAPGLAEMITRLIGKTPFDVVLTSEDSDQVGGLQQLGRHRVYATESIAAVPASSLHRIGGGDTINLGMDSAERPLILEVHALTGHSRTGLTLLDVDDRILFAGDCLGTQTSDAGLVLTDNLSEFQHAFEDWRRATDGRYDIVYTAHNHQWFTGAKYVDQLQQVVNRAQSGETSSAVASTRRPGFRTIASDGGPDVVASLLLPP
jgi:glyoxylase-like metal-dependent hydrolase (beta-lactamase superfamily II)